MTNHLGIAFPKLAQRLPKTQLADLPTPVKEISFSIGSKRTVIAVKYDNLTSELYGGNKVRKLEYLLHRARGFRVHLLLVAPNQDIKRIARAEYASAKQHRNRTLWRRPAAARRNNAPTSQGPTDLGHTDGWIKLARCCQLC